MKAASAFATGADGGAAAAEAAARVARALDEPAGLALVFFSAALASDAAAIGAAVREALDPRALAGATGGTIVEGSREIEDEPAVAVWAATLPETAVAAFPIRAHRSEEGVVLAGSPDVPPGASVLLLADPFTFPANAYVERLDEQKPGVVVGGLASGAAQPGGHRLLCDDDVLDSGAVAVVVHGRVRVRAMVSQGCRPIGMPATVTRAERNVVHEMANATPLERIRETFAGASPDEQALMQRGLHVGRVVDEYKTEFERGDFLIRNVMGVDPDTGAMAVGDLVSVGETIQLHVRDALTADEDLRAAAGRTLPPAAAVLFTCNGRGSHLFGEPDHDAGVLAGTWPGTPLAGMSCSGEIGPVGGRTFLHGFTASTALFYDDETK